MSRLKLALDIGSYYTKLLVQKPYHQGTLIAAGKMVRTPAGAVRHGEIIEADALTEMLRSLLKPYLSKGDVLCSVGMPSLIHRQLMLPWVKKGEFEALVRLQIERLTSETLKNYLIDYRITRYLQDEGVKKAEVTIYALPRKIIDSYLDLFKEAGIKPYILDVQPNCLSKLFAPPEGNDEKEGSYALIDIGYSMTGIHIMDKGTLAFTRYFPLGSAAFDEAIMDYYQVSQEEAERMKQSQVDFKSEHQEIGTLNRLIQGKLAPIAAEIQRVFRFFAARSQRKTLEKAYLFGGVSHLKNLEDYLGGLLDCTILLPDSFTNVTLPKELRDEKARDYINCLGALVRMESPLNGKERIRHA